MSPMKSEKIIQKELKQKNLVFRKLMSEHAGEENVIDLRNLVPKIQRAAWIQYDLKLDEEYIREKLMDYLDCGGNV